MNFDERLSKAIQRGERIKQSRAEEAAREALSAEEAKRLHGQFQVELSEYIETCLRRLADHLPGFRLESIVGEKGWGAAVSRDDLLLHKGTRTNAFSRLEMVVRPLSKYPVLDLAARGTVRNRELFDRQHFEKLADVDVEKFRELVDRWVLEYAEQYAART